MTAPEYGSTGSMNGVAAQVAGTRSWARILSVTNYLGMALMVLVGLGLIFAVGAIPNAPPGASAGAGIFYILCSALYVYPGIQFGRVASISSKFEASTSLTDLEDFLRAQRRVTKFYGILLLIGIVLTVLMIVLAIVLGGLGALMAVK